MSKKPKASEIKRGEENASKLSCKSIARVPAYNYGLSITLDDKGHVLSPEGYTVAEEVFKLIYDKMDEELMLLRVDKTYK